MFKKIKEFFTGKQPVAAEVPYKVEAPTTVAVSEHVRVEAVAPTPAPTPAPEVKVEAVAPKALVKKQQFEKKAATPKTPAKPRAPRKPKSEAAK